tara:strand:+ start:496 stop:1137 length:642 start_codon:yes stop_codon:yes gene_type:complete
MRAVRVDFDLESIIHTSLIRSALNSVSWDFRGIINQQDGDLLIMCECITLNSPPPPPGFGINGITIEKHLQTWQNKLLTHTLLVLRFSNEILGKYFLFNDLTILAGTNLTSKGLIVQLSGSSESITPLLNELKRNLNVRSISSAKGGKGMISSTISSEEYRVLQAAHSNGWYNSPKSTSLRDLAKELKISKSSVSNHLNSSESKIISNFFESD